MSQEYYNLYVETDEEVTTMISRLTSAPSARIALIVPQNALVLQSIINLRLLAREAASQGKTILLVTQDDEGMSFAKRVGIVCVPLQQWQESQREESQGLDQVSAQQVVSEDELSPFRGEGRIHQTPYTDAQGTQEQIPHQRHHPVEDLDLMQFEGQISPHETPLQTRYGDADERLGRVSDMNYDGSLVHAQIPTDPQNAVNEILHRQDREKIDPQLSISQDGVMPYQAQGLTAGQTVYDQTAANAPAVQIQPDSYNGNADRASHDGYYQDAANPQLAGSLQSQADTHVTRQPKSVELYYDGASRESRDADSQSRGGIFSHFLPKRTTNFQESVQKMSSSDEQLSFPENRPFRKIYRLGWGLALLSLFVVLSYLFLPLSIVTVRIGDIIVNEQLTVTASADTKAVDVERRKIPLRIIEKEIIRSVTVPTTGKADVAAQKAFGTIKIINALDGKPQTLVATTRFRSPDGVIFRLVKATTVPGMKIVNDKVIPGTVEASVVADSSGDSGNIGPTTWQIPGFESNARKFEKITGQSTAAMDGGSAGGKDTSIVTEADIATAKKKAETGLSEYVLGEIAKLVAPSQELMPGAITSETVRAESIATAQTATSELEYVIASKVRAYVFERGDVESIAQSVSLEKDAQTSNLNAKVVYSAGVPDFKQEKLVFVADASFNGDAQFDIEAFKGAIVGKRHGDLKELLKSDFPYVRDVAITAHPSFPAGIGTRFSRYGFMNKVRVAEGPGE